MLHGLHEREDPHRATVDILANLERSIATFNDEYLSIILETHMWHDTVAASLIADSFVTVKNERILLGQKFLSILSLAPELGPFYANRIRI